MNHRLLISSGAIRRTAMRGFWLALLAAHVPIAARVLAAVTTGELDATMVGSLAAIIPTIAFFALKVFDVPWLRLPSRAGSFIAFALVAAIAHHEVLPTIDEPLGATVTVSVAAAVIGQGLRRLRSLIPRQLPSLTFMLAGMLDRRPHATVPGLGRPSIHGCRAPPALFV